MLHHAPVGFLLDSEIAASGKFHRPQNANRILSEANVGVADGSDQARLQVDESVDVVDDLASLHVVEETVDGKVATAGVFDGVAELVVVPDEQVVLRGTIAIPFAALVVLDRARIGAKRGCLDDLPAKEDMSQSETPANDAAIPE